MNKRCLAAIAAGLITASCAGHGSGSGVLPGTAAQPQAGPSKVGAYTTRPKKRPRLVPVGWSATATGPLSISGTTDLGELPATKTIGVHVALQLRNVDQVKSAIAPRQIISPSTFLAS